MLPHSRNHIDKDIMQEQRSEGAQGEGPVLQSFSILAASIIIAKRFLDFALRPPFQRSSGCVDLIICPLHELVPVVAPRTMVTNKLISCLTSICVGSHLFLKIGSNGPQTHLDATEAIEHEVQAC